MSGSNILSSASEPLLLRGSRLLCENSMNVAGSSPVKRGRARLKAFDLLTCFSMLSDASADLRPQRITAHIVVVCGIIK